MKKSLGLLLVISIFLPLAAQDMTAPAPITAANVYRLQSVAHIDFEPLDCDFGIGWFELSPDGAFIAALDSQQHLYVWDANGQIVYADNLPCTATRNTTQLAFDTHNALYTFEQVAYDVTVTKFNLANSSRATGVIALPESLVLAAWAEADKVWLEVRENNQAAVLAVHDIFAAAPELETFTYAPGNDPDAIARIGRIPPPYTVTSSRDGVVKLWNIQMGEIVYEVDNGTGEAAVFGAINHAATQLIWRDSRNASLYLLNFETGENHFVANLDGQYAQWYFLSQDASIALAVNLGFEPNIVAWDTASGEQTILGEYRQCNRPQPDMARLSADGTTLVIGCDTGLDIWRVGA
jgi:hypothetical protein